MKKLITLAALLSIVGVTWAVAATPTSPGTEAHMNHPMHAMGSGHGRMHGMMGGHEAERGSGHGKGAMHGKDMAACDMPTHGGGKHDHQQAKPEK